MKLKICQTFEICSNPKDLEDLSRFHQRKPWSFKLELFL